MSPPRVRERDARLRLRQVETGTELGRGGEGRGRRAWWVAQPENRLGKVDPFQANCDVSCDVQGQRSAIVSPSHERKPEDERMKLQDVSFIM